MATFEEVKDVPNHPEKYLIDVREIHETKQSGLIPASINIPLGELETALKLTDDQFLEKYNRDKPQHNSPLIFTCMSGKRAANAGKLAQNLDYENVKVYAGSWNEWMQKKATIN